MKGTAVKQYGRKVSLSPLAVWCECALCPVPLPHRRVGVCSLSLSFSHSSSLFLSLSPSLHLALSNVLVLTGAQCLVSCSVCSILIVPSIFDGENILTNLLSLVCVAAIGNNRCACVVCLLPSLCCSRQCL